jgi:hypothetical protein
MTELTRKYLQNYLEKKSLVMAAEQEVNESRLPGTVLIETPATQLGRLRHQTALAMWSELARNAQNALSYYLEHLESEA